MVISHFFKNNFVILIIFMVSFSCTENSYNEKIIDRNREVLNYIRDTADILIVENDFEISGRFESECVEVIYSSVTPEKFYNAFLKSDKNFKYFSQEVKFNEAESKNIYRSNDSLMIRFSNNKYKSYVDRERVRYFYEDNMNGIHVIKRFYYKDNDTFFIDSYSGDVILNITDTNVTTLSDENLVFYADIEHVNLKDSTKISFFRVTNSSIDTIATAYVDGFIYIPFFENRNKLYYVHNIIDNNTIRQAAYAKMEINWKSN